MFQVLALGALLALLQRSDTSPDVELLAARVVLIALRAGLHDRERTTTETYVLEPEEERLGQGAVIDKLSTMAKPLFCDASADGSVVRIRCRTITTAAALDYHTREAEESVTTFGQAVRVASPVSGADPLLELRGYEEEMVSPLSAVLRFFRAYEVGSSVMRLDPSDEQARRHGAAAVLVFGRGNVSIVDSGDR